MIYNLLPKVSNNYYSTPVCCNTSQAVGWMHKSTPEKTPSETDDLQEWDNRKASRNTGSFLQNSDPPVITSQVEVLRICSIKLSNETVYCSIIS